MAGITIRYCVPCRYQFKAMQDADAILKEFGQTVSELRLVPGDHGVYDVEVDGDLVFSLDQSGEFPETPELIQKIHARIDSPRSRKKKG